MVLTNSKAVCALNYQKILGPGTANVLNVENPQMILEIVVARRFVNDGVRKNTRNYPLDANPAYRRHVRSWRSNQERRNGVTNRTMEAAMLL